MLTLISFGQDNFNKWSIDLGAGINKAWSYRGQATGVSIPSISLGGRYMLNNVFGLNLEYDYNRFGKSSSNFTPIDLHSITGGTVVNLGHILRFETFAPKLGLLANIGAGVSFMPYNTSAYSFSDIIVQSDAIDHTFHGTVSFIPQYKITPKVSLNLILSTTVNTWQNYAFDGTPRTSKYGLDGLYSTLSIGASIYFGKAEEHADWTPTEFGEKNLPIDNSMAEANAARIKVLEDSIANMKTMSDRDGDGVADAYDDCPDEAGKFSDNGCPNADRDGDGINDLQDKCPDIPGVLSNNGCPNVNVDVKTVMNIALKGVKFKSGNAVLLKRSNPVLNNVVQVMKENPSYFLNVWGYSDNSGDDATNLKLSSERANAVAAFLVANGVEQNRLHPAGFGNTNPISNNDYDWGRALNRRVEFTVVFK